MVDSTICPRCSSPIRPGELSCSNCGAPLAAGTEGDARDGNPGVRRDTGQPPDSKDPTGGEAEAGVEEAEALSTPAALPVHVPAGWPLDLRSMAESPAPPRPPEPEPEPEPAEPGPEPEPEPGPEPGPEPADDAEGHVSGGYLAPSAIYRGSGGAPLERDQAGSSGRSDAPGMSVSIGAVPVTSAGIDTLLKPRGEALGPAPAPVAPPATAFVGAPAAVAPSSPEFVGASAPVAPPATAFVGASAPGPSAPGTSATPSADLSGAKPAATTPQKGTVQQLVAFGLVATGGVLGIASFFLPWAGSTGIGIGTVAMAGSPPQPNQWAWGMPAAIPLFLLTVIVLGAAAGGDRAQRRLPKAAPIIARVTDLILPMLLGGVYFGIALLYATLPPQFGYGTGIFVLFVAACLLVAGAILALFFPAEDGSTAD